MDSLSWASGASGLLGCFSTISLVNLLRPLVVGPVEHLVHLVQGGGIEDALFGQAHFGHQTAFFLRILLGHGAVHLAGGVAAALTQVNVANAGQHNIVARRVRVHVVVVPQVVLGLAKVLQPVGQLAGHAQEVGVLNVIARPTLGDEVRDEIGLLEVLQLFQRLGQAQRGFPDNGRVRVVLHHNLVGIGGLLPVALLEPVVAVVVVYVGVVLAVRKAVAQNGEIRACLGQVVHLQVAEAQLQQRARHPQRLGVVVDRAFQRADHVLEVGAQVVRMQVVVGLGQVVQHFLAHFPAHLVQVRQLLEQAYGFLVVAINKGPVSGLVHVVHVGAFGLAFGRGLAIGRSCRGRCASRIGGHGLGCLLRGLCLGSRGLRGRHGRQFRNLRLGLLRGQRLLHGLLHGVLRRLRRGLLHGLGRGQICHLRHGGLHGLLRWSDGKGVGLLVGAFLAIHIGGVRGGFFRTAPLNVGGHGVGHRGHHGTLGLNGLGSLDRLWGNRLERRLRGGLRNGLNDGLGYWLSYGLRRLGSLSRLRREGHGLGNASRNLIGSRLRGRKLLLGCRSNGCGLRRRRRQRRLRVGLGQCGLRLGLAALPLGCGGGGGNGHGHVGPLGAARIALVVAVLSAFQRHGAYSGRRGRPTRSGYVREERERNLVVPWPGLGHVAEAVRGQGQLQAIPPGVKAHQQPAGKGRLRGHALIGPLPGRGA